MKWLTSKLKKKFKVYGNKWKWKHYSPNPLDAEQAVLSRKYLAIQACLKKQERSQTYNITLHPKELEKEQPKAFSQEKGNNKDYSTNEHYRNKQTKKVNRSMQLRDGYLRE